MGNIPEESIEAVSAATDIVDLISSYIPIKRAGGQFVALCPFHNERTPSLSISPQRQAFHCFGCGESGGAIGFVMKYENLPFGDAVKKLADKVGIPIIEDAIDPAEDKARRRRSRIIKLHNEAAEYMHRLLMRSPQAAHGRDYLKSRGFGTEMAKRWKIGWMPDDYNTFLNWAKEAEYKARELVDGSLAGLRDPENPAKGIYAKFRNRLMFPIHNDYGDVIAFSGRQLVEDPRSGKYINSNETSIFKKSKVFFGLDKARKQMTKEKFALLCEGQIDVISCFEAGIENAVAGLGTALTEDHARILKRYTSNATLCFDADTAGYKAAESAFKELVKQGFNVKVVKMPEGEDPDSLIKKNGVESFRQLVAKATDFYLFKYETAKEQSDLSDIQQRNQLVNDMGQLLALIPDKTAKDGTIAHVATILGVGAEEFKAKIVDSERKKKFEQKFARPKQSYGPQGQTAPEPEKITPTLLDRIIGNLCLYSLYDSVSMNYLCEQMESFSEAITQLQGGELLLEILSKRPKCNTPAAMHTFMLKMKEGDRLAISALMAEPLPEDIFQATQDTTSMMLNSHLQRREAAIRAALKRTDLSPEQEKDLLQEAKDIALLLQGIPQRFIH